MNKLDRLKTRKQFVALRDCDMKIVTPFFVIQYARTEDHASLACLAVSQNAAVGFTVTKKLGNAVRRNRIKRRLRSIVQEVFPEYAHRGYAYVVIGRYRAYDADYSTLIRHAKTSLQRIHVKRVV